MTGTTPFRALFGADSRIPLDVIFPGPPPEAVQWPDYVREKQHKLQRIYCFMREKQEAAVQRATAYQSGQVEKATKLEEGRISNSAGEPEEEERKAEEEAREPNDMEEMREQIVDQCPRQVPLSGDPISPNGSASPELKRQTTPVVPSYRQGEGGEPVREFAEPPWPLYAEQSEEERGYTSRVIVTSKSVYGTSLPGDEASYIS